MAVKYVKDFEFSKDAGFSGSCTPVKKAMGGSVTRQLGDIMSAARRSPELQQMMAQADRQQMAERPMQGAPQQPQPTMMKKGGSVKGKKIAKVMREYKKGELHSGSKKGPVVKNPKQAMAIALSEAGRMKKAEGGEVKKPKKKEESKKPKMKVEDLALKKMRHAEKYAPGMDLDNIHSYELSEEAKKEKKVEKYQAGGMAERRAAREANIAKMRSKSEALRAARRPVAEGSARAASRAALDAKHSAARAERDAARQAMYARQDARMAARMAKKNRPAAPEAPPRMAKGGDVKKAVHKHEKAMHPGKPLTKLKKGGLPVHQGSPMYGRK